MYNILVITDDKLSSLNQSQALVNELTKLTDKKISVTYKKIKRNFLNFFPNFFIYFCLLIKSFIYKKKYIENVDLIISCGRVSAPHNLILKKINHCLNCHILNPYFLNKKFDKIVIPAHDEQRINFKENLIVTTGTLVNLNKISIKKKDLEIFTRFIDKKKNIISVLIGGSGKSSYINENELDNIITNLNKLNYKYEVIYCFSRRTPISLKNYIVSHKKRFHKIFPKNKINPYWFLIKYSDFFFVTEDSVSMTSDIIATGKPVFAIPIKKIKKKIRFFQNDLRDRGITKTFKGKFFKWNYRPVQESMRIGIILKKSFFN